MNNLNIKILRYFLIVILSSLILNTSKSFSQVKVIRGTVTDKVSNKPIPFATIGVKNKPVGTVSDSLGNFSLLQNYAEIEDKDSLFVSSIGYEPFKTIWSLFKQNPATIFLNPKPSELAAVNISAPKALIKIFGREPAAITLSPKGYKSIPHTSDEKGREQASIISIDKDIFLRTLKVQILNRKEKSITFRMNVYSVKNDVPDESILTKNVIFTVIGPRETGIHNLQSIDLTPYKIRLIGYKKIALGIEIIDRELADGDTTNTAFYIPSYPSPLRSSFYRLKSQSPWEKLGSSYLIASLDAAVLKNGDVQELPDNDDLVLKSLTKLYGRKMMFGNNVKAGRKIKLKDANIYFETYGEGEPILLLHGNNEGINSFSEQIGPLSKHFKVITVDTRGQGNSTNSFEGKYTYELFAADMKELLDSLQLKQVNILGWSDGGNTGLLMAIHYPEYVNKLAIMGSNAFSGPNAIDPAVLKIFEERSRVYENKADIKSINQKRLADLVLNEPNISAQELQTIRAPTLIIAGENDVIKKEHTLFLHENIKNSEMGIIRGGDHYAPLKASKVFNQLILDFYLRLK